MLEHQCGVQKNDESVLNSQASAPYNLSSTALKYVPGALITQQPMFLTSILNALKLVNISSSYRGTILIFYIQACFENPGS